MWTILIAVFTMGAGTCKCEPDSTRKDRSQISRRLTANKYHIREIEDKKYQSIIMKDFAICSTPGRPMLPYRLEEFVLPKNVDLSSVQLEISIINSEVLASTYSVQPAPQPWRDPKHEIADEKELTPDKFVVFRDETIYSKDAFFPTEPVILIGVATKGTDAGQLVKIARVLYSPFQYNPITGKMRLTKEVDVTLSYVRNK
jgi:hypothetical protein